MNKVEIMLESISCPQIKEILSQGGQLIDVRSHFEFSSGALEGAVNIPLEQIHYHAESIDKETPILLYCRSGQRSAYAKQIMEVLGFTNLYNIGSYEAYSHC
jgi:phage shock protein E